MPMRYAFRRWLSVLLTGVILMAGSALAPSARGAQDPVVADCAATGVTLQNGGFESPALSGPSAGLLPAAGGVPYWQTTDTEFEVWNGGFGGVTAAAGVQHVELNAHTAGTLFQAVATMPGTVVQWRFAHRARLVVGPPGSAEDTMELLIGPTLGGIVTQGQFTDDDLDWGYHSGLYTVPPGQTSTIFAFQAVSSSSGNPSAGNFLDDISFATSACLVVTTSIADANGGSVQRGDVLTVTTMVQNAGYSTASGLRLSGAAPPQTVHVPGSLIVDGSAVTDAAADDRGEITGSAVTWRAGTGADSVSGGALAPGSGAVASFQVVVHTGASGAIASTSIADGAWTGSGPLATSTSTTASVTLALADLATVKTVAAANVGSTVAGEPLRYDIATANAGPDDAVDVLVSDPLPAALMGATATPDPALAGGSCVVAGGLATCTYPVLAVGATATTRISGTVDPSLAVGSDIGTTATSAARTEDPALANNTSSSTAEPSSAEADLAVSVRFGSGKASAAGAPAAPAAIAPGDAIHLTARVVNSGPSDSPASTVVVMLDPVGRSWVVVPSMTESCLVFGSRVICSLGPLPSGNAVTLEISGVLGAAAPVGNLSLTSSATVTGSYAPDPSPANDTASARLAVQILATADLGTITVLTTPIVVGGPVAYVVTTANAGPSNAFGLSVTTVVPEGVSDPVGAPDPSFPGGVCVSAGRTITCTYPVLRPGIAVRTSVTGRADDGLTLAIALTASASSISGTPDLDASNNSASD
ncbi:MAG: muc4, partial [Jatrophihabitantaceae bacterium]|nr:muc4 [Jatrophihabitantaceae bacterium]